MYKCELTGKSKQFGKNVSFSKRRTPKVQKANLQNKRINVNGQMVKMKISTSAMRTMKKRSLKSEAKQA